MECARNIQYNEKPRREAGVFCKCNYILRVNDVNDLARLGRDEKNIVIYDNVVVAAIFRHHVDDLDREDSPRPE